MERSHNIYAESTANQKLQQESITTQISNSEMDAIQKARQSASDMMRLFDDNLNDLRMSMQSAQGSTNTIEIDMNVEAALSGENSEGSEDERTKEMMARRAKGGASQRIGLPVGALINDDDEDSNNDQDAKGLETCKTNLSYECESSSSISLGITSSDVHSANGFSVERRQPDGYCENDIEDVFDMFEDAHFLEENECNSEYMITEADGFGDEDTMSFEHEQQNIGEDEEEYFEELQPISDDDSSNLWTQVNDELSNPGNQSSFIGKNLDGHTRSQATNNAHHVNNTNNIPAQTNSLERALDSNIQCFDSSHNSVPSNTNSSSQSYSDATASQNQNIQQDPGNSTEEWNPFLGLTPEKLVQEKTKNKRLSAKDTKAVEETRKRALQASLQFEQEILRGQQRKEAARQRKAMRKASREEAARRLAQQERACEEQREAAFQRREEAKHTRMKVIDPFAPFGSTDLQTTGKPLREENTEKQEHPVDSQANNTDATHTGLLIELDDNALPKQYKKLTRKSSSSVPLLPFSLPQQEDEIAKYDSDEDIYQAEGVMAELAREIRAVFAPVLYPGYAYDPNDPVELYAKLLRQGRDGSTSAVCQRKSVTEKSISMETSSLPQSPSPLMSHSDNQDVFSHLRMTSPSFESFSSTSDPRKEEVTRISAGMYRLEQQLRLLPTLFQRALEECGDDSDEEQLQSIMVRVQEIRTTYKRKLEDSNARLAQLGVPTHDLSSFDFGETSKPQPTAGELAAKMISVAEDGGHDENFNILSALGLLSTRTANPFTENITDSNDDQSSLEKDNRICSSQYTNEATAVSHPESALSELLQELDIHLTETTVMVTDTQNWNSQDGSVFSDYELTFASNESCFPAPSSVVRRTYLEIKWLQQQVKDMNPTSADFLSLPTEADITVDLLASYLTSLVQDELIQEHHSIIKFFFEPNCPVEQGLLPPVFSCNLDNFSREELACLPLSYLRAIAAATDTSIRGCVTNFEFADRILAKHAGLNEEEAVPLSPDNSDGVTFFKGIHQVEDELFDTLASARVNDTDMLEGQQRDTVELDASVAHRDRNDSVSNKSTCGPEKLHQPTNKNFNNETESKFNQKAMQRKSHGRTLNKSIARAAASPEVNENIILQKELSNEADQMSSGGYEQIQQHPINNDNAHNKTDRIAVTVPAFLSSIRLEKYISVLVDAGYDDLRVVATIKAQELETIGITNPEEVDIILREGMSWQTRAAHAMLLDNWTRWLLRGTEDGFLVISQEDQDAAVQNKQNKKQSAGLSIGIDTHGTQAGSRQKSKPSRFRVEGNFMVDQFGNINLKAGDEDVEFKFSSSAEWDPTPVLRALYDNERPEIKDECEGDNVTFGTGTVRIEGYLEKLPKGTTKSSVLKRWQRRYFKVRDGELFYFDEDKASHPAGFIRLRGSQIRYKGGNLLEIHDPKKSVNMILKASSTTELEDWKLALDSEASTIRLKAPRSKSRLNDQRNTLIFDIGGSSTRAGFAESGLAWPNVFMPTCVATNRHQPSERVCGIEALHPSVRTASDIRYPLQSADTFSDATNIDLLDSLYGDLFSRVGCDPSERTLIMTEPPFLTKRDRVRIAEIMMETYGVPALYMKPQALLSMFSYGATTGVIVDIGQRCDVIPLDSGYMIERGVGKLRIGGNEVTEALARMMSEQGHRFFSPVEQYIGRYVKERIAFVAPDYQGGLNDEELGKIEARIVDARRFAVPDGSKSFEFKGPRFRCTEGLFQPCLWGKDVPGVHELVHRAIMSSSIDMRKSLSRNIYLSGGCTLIPGFAERLQTELQYTLPAACAVKVHASPHRHHAAFQGAAVLAGLPNFGSLCVWNEDWQEVGPDILLKWDEDSVNPYDRDGGDSDDSDGEMVGIGMSETGWVKGGGVEYVCKTDSDVDAVYSSDHDEETVYENTDSETFKHATTSSAWSGYTDNDVGISCDDPDAASEFDEPEEMEGYV